MKRKLILILVLLAAAGTHDALAQARRVRPTAPPKNEHNEKSEPREGDEAKNDSHDKSQDKNQDDNQDKAQGEKKDDDDQPLKGEDVTVRAVIKSKPNPGYPPGARRYAVQGAVKLRIILGADGRVREQMEVLEGLPYGVTEEAIRAARLIEFEPARKNGRPVSQYVTVIYHFRLH
ncbi:MAG TPA: energy transducer TonB [Pyrinomonadaceae bacterium]|nr:energy transducer TonB [Pyrinomonadaceae bacterium]